MSQSFPNNVKTIYETISQDTDITDRLGNYEFTQKIGTKGGTAISVLSPGQDLPSIRKVSGVECVIQDVGDFTKHEYLSGDKPTYAITWNVFLIVWEPSTGQDMLHAAEKICNRFLGAEAVQTVAASDGIGAQAQMKIIIKSDMPIVPA